MSTPREDVNEHRQDFEHAAAPFQVEAPHGKMPLTVALIGVHALGAVAYMAIGATFIGWETCDIPGADGGADIAAGIAFLPVFVVVLLASLVCLGRAVYVYGRYGRWPISRYAFGALVFWAFAAFVLQCPR